MTVQTLGQYMAQLVDNNHNIDMPGDIRRIVQQVNSNALAATKKKPMFIERKIGKSMSVNSQLGFPLKVLEELNESLDKESATGQTGTASKTVKTKAPFFENTYQHIRQQSRMRPTRLDPNQINEIKLPEHVEKAIEHMTSPKQTDSGIATPISPPNTLVFEAPNNAITHYSPDMHPFSNCEDVNFKFNGTTQLKSIRPMHHHPQNRSASVTEHANTDIVKNGRS